MRGVGAHAFALACLTEASAGSAFFQAVSPLPLYGEEARAPLRPVGHPAKKGWPIGHQRFESISIFTAGPIDNQAAKKKSMSKPFLSLVLAAALGSCITLALQSGFSTSEYPARAGSIRTVNQFRNASPLVRGADFDFREAARRATPAVVHIATQSGAPHLPNEGRNPFRFFYEEEGFPSPFRDLIPREGTGSGVLYTSDGYIVTNYHVIADADRIAITLADNRQYKARVVGTDPATDLAVLKIDARGLPTLKVADARRAEVGEWVLAIGNPLELNSTVTAGIISARGRNLDLLPGEGAIESFIQTDAAVNPGNSGGALVNTRGELLGINTAIASQTGWYAGYSFAIPANIVQRIADDIIQFGIFKRAYLGIDVSELDAAYARELGLDVAQGVVVERVLGNGSAAHSGLQVKDVIIAAGGRAVRAVPDLQEVVASAAPGQELELRVLRNGVRIDIRLQLKAR